MLIVHTFLESTLAQRWQRIWATLILVCATLMLPTPAQAAITPQYATLSRMSDGGYSVNADFRFSMPQQLQDAINHGTPITFTVDFEMSRRRWYWANEDVISTRRDYRVILWMKKHELAIRSAVLIAIADTPEEEVYSPDGKGRLQKRLTAAINKVLTDTEGFGGVDAVYFKSFIVQ